MAWDVIVVGAGLAGTAATRRLVDAGQSVLLIEGATATTDPPGAHLRNRPPLRDHPDTLFPVIDDLVEHIRPDSGPASLPGAFLTSSSGGMGVFWTNNCPRAVAGTDRSTLLSEHEWDRCYSRAERDLYVRSDQFSDSFRQQAITGRLGPVLAESSRTLCPLPLSGWVQQDGHVHYVGPSDVLAPVQDRVSRLAGKVERVVTKGDRATGVVVDGVVHGARHVLVTAGAIETPLLLWRSGLGTPALGRYVSFHPVIIGQMVLDEELTAGDDDPVPRLGIPPTPEHPWFTMLLRDTNPLPVKPDDRDIAPGRLVEIQTFAPVEPDIANVLTMDGNGLPRFDVPLRDGDEARRRRIAEDADSLCAQIGRFRAGCTPQWAPLGTPHLMGTCRMGARDDGTSVTAPDGRVWGVDNLYLSTNGVIDSRLAVNPTLTTVALGVRAVESICRASSASR